MVLHEKRNTPEFRAPGMVKKKKKKNRAHIFFSFRLYS